MTWEWACLHRISLVTHNRTARFIIRADLWTPDLWRLGYLLGQKLQALKLHRRLCLHHRLCPNHRLCLLE